MSTSGGVHSALLVDIKRSKSAPGFIEASCRLSMNAPSRWPVSDVQRLSSINESDDQTPSPAAITFGSAFDLRQGTPHSSNSALAVLAPLASSSSLASSSNPKSALVNEIESLKKTLVELDQRQPSANSPAHQQRYRDVQQRLTYLQNKHTSK